MPFTKSAVELFISERVAAITACGASEMKALVPDSAHWLSHVGLAIIFNDFPPAAMRPFVINFIRRVYAAFLEYDLARQEVLKLIKDGSGLWSPYFAALTNFEVTVAQLYLAIDSIRKNSVGCKLFTKGDGSIEQRLNLIYNKGKHQLAEAELPVWFTNEGLASTGGASVTFVEFEDFMQTMADVVKGMCNREIALEALQP